MKITRNVLILFDPTLAGLFFLSPRCLAILVKVHAMLSTNSRTINEVQLGRKNQIEVYPIKVITSDKSLFFFPILLIKKLSYLEILVLFNFLIASSLTSFLVLEIIVWSKIFYSLILAKVSLNSGICKVIGILIASKALKSSLMSKVLIILKNS